MPNNKKEENMSTRSNIAIEDPKTKKVKVIYVHSDGYPYGVGKCLVDNYNNRQLAEELFKSEVLKESDQKTLMRNIDSIFIHKGIMKDKKTDNNVSDIVFFKKKLI